MKKSYSIILYYLVLIGSILAIHKLSPTNMAGPGLDIVITIFALIIGVALFAKSIMKVRSADRSSYIPFIVNVIGIITIVLIMYYS